MVGCALSVVNISVGPRVGRCWGRYIKVICGGKIEQFVLLFSFLSGGFDSVLIQFCSVFEHYQILSVREKINHGSFFLK